MDVIYIGHGKIQYIDTYSKHVQGTLSYIFIYVLNINNLVRVWLRGVITEVLSSGYLKY